VTATGPVVLVVEDEPQMRRFLRASLKAQGYCLLEAATGKDAVLLATSHNPDVVLLDLGLPDADGIDLMRTLRERNRVPIIIISARGREDDKVAALDAGADDYLTKPFGVNELLARMRVALRHAQGLPEPKALEFGDLKIDFVRHEVMVAQRQVHLTPIEYRLLQLLAQNAGRVLTHRQILNEIWGPNHVSQTHYVRVHMAELRKKIEADPARPRLILTELGVGYRLRDREP
jgi:two-component system, OmpR family, KDP operon response regulator KdpE